VNIVAKVSTEMRRTFEKGRNATATMIALTKVEHRKPLSPVVFVDKRQERNLMR
jgi:hypothetical protein